MKKLKKTEDGIHVILLTKTGGIVETIAKENPFVYNSSGEDGRYFLHTDGLRLKKKRTWKGTRYVRTAVFFEGNPAPIPLDGVVPKGYNAMDLEILLGNYIPALLRKALAPVSGFRALKDWLIIIACGLAAGASIYSVVQIMEMVDIVKGLY